MERYIGIKEVYATPMTRGEYNRLRGWKIPEDENESDDGYLVEYKDGGKPNHPYFHGYISWSPKDVFERSYKSTDCGMGFNFAINLLKNGNRITRTKWDKGTYLYREDSVCGLTTGGTLVESKILDDSGSEWSPSQEDIFADDWIIFK